VVAWAGSDTAALERAQVPFRTVPDVIGNDGLAAADAAARTWARVWGRLPLVDGKSLRDLVQWRGTSLLWTAEVFVRTATAGPPCVRTVETCLRLLDALAPTEVDAAGLSPADALLLARACTVRGVLFHARRPAIARPLRPPVPVPLAGARRALASLFAPRVPPALPAPATTGGPEGAPPLLVLVARREDAVTLRPLLEAFTAELRLPTVVVPTGDLPRWLTRRARRAVAEAEAFLREGLARLRGTAGLHESYAHHGVGFAELASYDLEALLLGRLPEAVRILEAAAELLATARPEAVLVVVPARDDRRALLAACGLAHATALALRLGAPDPDDADRADGGPRPVDSFAWEAGGDPAPLVSRLHEAVRGTVGAR
jgi:hypothetical protein